MIRPNNPKFLCLDIETTNLDWTTGLMHGISIAYEEGEAEYFLASEIPDYIIKDIEDPNISIVGHNLHAFDLKFLFKLGIRPKGKFIENMGIWQLLNDNSPLGLKYLSDMHIGAESLERKRRLDQEIHRAGVKNIASLCFKDLHDPTHPHLEVIADYCKEDCNNTLHLALLGMNKLRVLDKQLKEKYRVTKTPLDYFNEEFTPLESVLFKIETEGFRVNLSIIEKLRAEAEKLRSELVARLTKGFKAKIDLIEEEMYQTEIDSLVTKAAKAKRIKGQGKLAFSWENSNHVANLFFNHTNFPEDLKKTTERGSYAMDKTYLQSLLTELPKENILLKALPIYARYKLNQKILTTYTGNSEKGIYSKIRKAKDGNHYIYPTFRQTTSTGRLSCKSPNMQNLKRNSPIKELFIPNSDGNVFDHFDYSQIELRLAGHLAKDRNIIKAYSNGEDVHKQTAAAMFEVPEKEVTDSQRQGGKTTNFLMIYKGGAYRLQESLRQGTGLEFTLEECKEFIEKFFNRYPDLTQYLINVLNFVKKNRFVISEVGRMRRLPDISYGDEGNLNYRIKKFNGSNEQLEQLHKDLIDKEIQVTDENLFWQAHKRYNHAIKQAYNFPDQSLAASMIKRAMIVLNQKGFVLRNQVHDSIDIERSLEDKESKLIATEILESIYPCRLPIKVECKTLKSFSESDKVNED